MNTLLQIQQRSVYGVLTIYPINDVAQRFAEIAGTKTLTPKTLKLAEQLGFTIQVQAEDVDAWRTRGQSHGAQ